MWTVSNLCGQEPGGVNGIPDVVGQLHAASDLRVVEKRGADLV